MDVTWESLSPEVRRVLILASEEAPLWELCTPSSVLDADGTTSASAGFSRQEAERLVRDLVAAGLVAMYWLTTSSRTDLASSEVENVLSSEVGWEAGVPPTVYLYLTAAGQTLCDPEEA